jgi:hypothetical protein
MINLIIEILTFIAEPYRSAANLTTSYKRLADRTYNVLLYPADDAEMMPLIPQPCIFKGEQGISDTVPAGIACRSPPTLDQILYSVGAIFKQDFTHFCH